MFQKCNGSSCPFPWVSHPKDPKLGRLPLGWQKAPLMMKVINLQRHFPPLW